MACIPTPSPVFAKIPRMPPSLPALKLRPAAPAASFNPALQRTAPRVTVAASAAAFPPTMQVPRRTPLSLSLGSLGDARHRNRPRHRNRRALPGTFQ